MQPVEFTFKTEPRGAGGWGGGVILGPGGDDGQEMPDWQAGEKCCRCQGKRLRPWTGPQGQTCSARLAMTQEQTV